MDMLFVFRVLFCDICDVNVYICFFIWMLSNFYYVSFFKFNKKNVFVEKYFEDLIFVLILE